MENVGLVLEGGGMRGLYTCGVLEFFMEKDLYFNYLIGVSAGACNAVSYIARQKGRNKKVNIQFAKDWRYMSFRNLLLKKSFFGMDFIFEEIPRKHVPFDFETFHKADCRFLIGTTDCNTGKPIYLNKEDLTEGFYALRATSALPFISPIINFKGYELLDGGISDSIPIAKSMEDGNTKNIIILTRNKEYRKSPIKHISLLKLKYKKYPSLIKTMTDRYKSYNETLEHIKQLEGEGKIIVIRPSEELKVGRLERDPKKLQELFESGYEDARNCYEKIVEFLSK
jgi:predicted patatin/cPLA2 family phospholipase